MENDTTPQITLLRAAKLQLAPALASLPVFAVLAWWLNTQGIPNIFALLLTVVFVETPISWAIMLRHVRRENDNAFSFAKAFPWMKKNPWWLYLFVGIPLIIFSAGMVAVVTPAIDSILVPALFAWVPDWFLMIPDPEIFSSLPRLLVLTLWASMLFGMVLIGGFTQEIYARGFLLPRIAHLGAVAPLYNALLFAVLHLIAPWSWISFFVMTLPWAYLVWWRRSTKIGLFIHIGMLALQWVGMSMVVFGLVEMPG